MNIYIARQPIFDRKSRIFGYELLFRQSGENCFHEMDDDIATAELIYNAFLVFDIDSITDGTKAFINFSKALVNSDFLELLPKNRIAVEILEREKATQATLDACRKFKMLGYTLAMDDYVLDSDNEPLLELVDIVKVDFPVVSQPRQADLIRKYKDKVKFLAEKIETREEYADAVRLGYDLFQGYFFSKPVMMKTKDIGLVSSNLLRVLEELNTPEPSYRKISDIVQSDLGLSYKLLKLVNSAYIAPRSQIKSIRHALGYLGMKELHQWFSLMMLKEMQSPENAEMLKQSLIRGKLMSVIAQEKNLSDSTSEYYFTGIFSQIDAILNKDLGEILTGLPLTDRVKQALLGEPNELRAMLECVISFEKGAWKELAARRLPELVSPARFMHLFIDAVKWVKSVGEF